MTKCRWWRHLPLSRRMVCVETGEDPVAAEQWAKFKCATCGTIRMSVSGGGW